MKKITFLLFLLTILSYSQTDRYWGGNGSSDLIDDGPEQPGDGFFD